METQKRVVFWKPRKETFSGWRELLILLILLHRNSQLCLMIKNQSNRIVKVKEGKIKNGGEKEEDVEEKVEEE